MEILQTKAVITELEQHRHAIEEAGRMKLVALNEETIAAGEEEMFMRLTERCQEAMKLIQH